MDLSAQWLAERRGYATPPTVHEDLTFAEVVDEARLIAATLPVDPPNVTAARREVLRSLGRAT